MMVLLRSAKKADLDKIKKINDDVQPNPWSFKALENEISHGDAIALVATDPADELLGYLFGRSTCDGTELMVVGVAQAAQRQGVGKQLIRRLITESKAPVIFLEVSHRNTAARSLYEALGFKAYLVRRSYYPDGSDAVCMKLDIAKPQ